MNTVTIEKKIFHSLRIACAMCFIGHGAFGIITKPVWCNYFAVFGIEQKTAYQLMPVIGVIDILFGLIILFYPVRMVFTWLVVWGAFTALLRPLSGEPFAEFIERAGNYGAPLLLLILLAAQQNKPLLYRRISADMALNKKRYEKIKTGLMLCAFLIFLGHGWLNLSGKTGLIAQYDSLGFANPYLISKIIGLAEIAAACMILFRPSARLVLILFFWKVGSELFYPQYELFEWIERGGSYGVLLSLWFVIKYSSNPVGQILSEHRFSLVSKQKSLSVQEQKYSGHASPSVPHYQLVS